jgi:bla regulator protein blaR1
MNPMNLFSLGSFFRNAWPAIANHLWQSTLFAAAIALLVLLLRQNHARIRYALWVAASVKFLLPFSFLVSLGTRFGVSHKPLAPSQTDFLIVMQDLSRPFSATQRAQPALHSFALSVPQLIPLLALFFWLAGSVAVFLYWSRRMHQFSKALHNAEPVTSGLEHDSLRALEAASCVSPSINLVFSNSSTEPGILGIFRSTLVLPSGISDRLTGAQLQSVLLHELCHVRRRDNLTAALHMFVEALFWFHPLVWWIGARLVDERERACDEEVLRLGSDPQTYAESILKVCKFYLESPVACASGVTGSKLKKRIETIMRNRIPLRMNFLRKLLLSASACLAMAVPLVFGLLHPTQSRAQSQSLASPGSAFESVYLQPNTTGAPMAGFVISGKGGHAFQFKSDRFMATNTSLRELLSIGYQVQDSQIAETPAWFESDKYDLVAVLSSAEIAKRQQMTMEQRSQEVHELIQRLLTDRFKLAVRRESKLTPIYALVVSPEGSKLHVAQPGDTYPNGIKHPDGKPVVPGFFIPKSGEFIAQGLSIPSFVSTLSSQNLGRPIVNKTGLTGNYDFTLQWTPDSSTSTPNASLFPALEQQLGLKLEPQDNAMEILVVDHAEKPVTQAAAVPAPVPAQANPSTSTQSANKTVLADLKLDGDISNKDGLRKKLLKAWQDKEYDDPDKLIEEIDFAIRSDFQEHGYFKVVVEPVRSELLPSSNGPKRLVVTASVKQGAQYLLGTFAVRSAEPKVGLAIPTETLREQFHLRSGELFNVEEVKEGLRRTNGLYRDKGYSDVAVMPSTAVDETHHVINVIISIDEKPRNS